MQDSEQDRISKHRRLLENPYAFIEQLTPATRAVEAVAPQRPVASAPSPSRTLLENPYAYLDGEGNIAAHNRTTRVGRQSRWTDAQIEQKARALQLRLWREREAIWGGSVPNDPVDLLDPALALGVIGFNFELVEGLGSMRGKGGPVEVAGIIDTGSKVVRVGRQFPDMVRTFTAAHELGHAVLHPALGALHRDKPLDGSPAAVDRIEVEANRFATFFLMPEKLVRARFAELFQSNHFELTDDTAFALAGCSISDFLRSHGSRRQVARSLASATRYNGRHFTPLHQQFRVSREAMAIRLEELALLAIDA